MGQQQGVIRISGGTGDAERGPGTGATEAAEQVRILETGPTGIEALDPLVVATLDGETAYHPDASPERVRKIVAELEGGHLPTGEALAIVAHDPETAGLPIPNGGALTVGDRRVLARCGWAEPADAGWYADRGALLGASETADALETAAEIGLLGRGRGDGATDEPVATTWDAVGRGTGDPVVVLNANESDPNVRADRLLLASVPVEVLDGALAVARFVGATDVIAYLNERDDLAIERVRNAAESLSEHLDGPSVQIVTGPDEYMAGEMTAALESMEGTDRLEARLRPPGPEEHGLYGRPTVIHTPRTVAQVREAALRPEWFEQSAADPGTRLVTVAGDVESRATVELATEAELGTALDAGALDGRLKMAYVGGQFGGMTRSLDVRAAAPVLSAAGLGTDGVVEVFAEGRCPVAVAGSRAKFASEANCGRCVPCREGSQQLTELLRRIYDGSFDRAAVDELARVMESTSICEFGQAAPRPVVTAMAAFQDEFRAHADGRCPSGACGGEGA